MDFSLAGHCSNCNSSSSLPGCPFIDVPQTVLVNEPNGTIIKLIWKYLHQNHEWYTQIVTDNHTLHDQSNPNPSIIDEVCEYNFTTTEDVSNVNVTTVTLSILISDNVPLCLLQNN